MNDAKKLLNICLFMVFFLFALSPETVPTNDFEFHFEKSKNLEACPAPYLKEGCDSYPPLIHLVSGFFSFHLRAFILFQILIVALLVPVLLFLVTKKWWSSLLYFGSTIFYKSPLTGGFSQGFIVALFLLFLLWKNFWLRLLLVVIALLVHSALPLLLLFYWFLEVISPFLLEWFGTIKSKFLIAIPGFPVFNQGLKESIVFLVVATNPLAVFEGLKNIWRERKLDFALLIVASLYMNFAGNRAIWVAQIVLIIMACKTSFSKNYLYFSFYWLAFVLISFLFEHVYHDLALQFNFYWVTIFLTVFLLFIVFYLDEFFS